ncbi:MAG: LysR family transcriptional regulator [Bacteroidales bacterium]|nr:LysR family transcriptional regulator [Bacteroidales bacterium]
MLEDKRLRIFVTAVECGNFTAAARLLQITQPAVTQNIADLERELGAKLLERGRSGISLTEKGELFYGYARQILHWYKVASDAFHSHPLDINAAPAEPHRLKLDNGAEALIWTSGGDIHIELPKK